MLMSADKIICILKVIHDQTCAIFHILSFAVILALTILFFLYPIKQWIAFFWPHCSLKVTVLVQVVWKAVSAFHRSLELSTIDGLNVEKIHLCGMEYFIQIAYS